MNCREVQGSLSLYLYGELDFAKEEELELHLGSCAFCDRSFAREKTWHTGLNTHRRDTSLEMLARSRQELRLALSDECKQSKASQVWHGWAKPFDFSLNRWSMRLALMSFLVFVGFAGARWIDAGRISGPNLNAFKTAGMSIIDPAAVHIRDIQPDEQGHVRIVVDYEGEVTGSVSDKNVRKFLLAGTKESDPSIRVYSLESLNSQPGNDVRDALLFSIRHDPNAAVRLKAIEGLRRFADDHATRESLKFVLEHDQNPGVRSEAINILVPAEGKEQLTPQLVGMLQDILRSSADDDYVHARCAESLHAANVSVNLY